MFRKGKAVKATKRVREAATRSAGVLPSAIEMLEGRVFLSATQSVVDPSSEFIPHAGFGPSAREGETFAADSGHVESWRGPDWLVEPSAPFLGDAGNLGTVGASTMYHSQLVRSDGTTRFGTEPELVDQNSLAWRQPIESIASTPQWSLDWGSLDRPSQAPAESDPSNLPQGSDQPFRDLIFAPAPWTLNAPPVDVGSTELGATRATTSIQDVVVGTYETFRGPVSINVVATTSTNVAPEVKPHPDTLRINGLDLEHMYISIGALVGFPPFSLPVQEEKIVAMPSANGSSLVWISDPPSNDVGASMIGTNTAGSTTGETSWSSAKLSDEMAVGPGTAVSGVAYAAQPPLVSGSVSSRILNGRALTDVVAPFSTIASGATTSSIAGSAQSEVGRVITSTPADLLSPNLWVSGGLSFGDRDFDASKVTIAVIRDKFDADFQAASQSFHLGMNPVTLLKSTEMMERLLLADESALAEVANEAALRIYGESQMLWREIAAVVGAGVLIGSYAVKDRRSNSSATRAKLPARIACVGEPPLGNSDLR